jgi:NAD(P)H-hydrate epimerase
MLPVRRRDAHKGDFGEVLVIAGSVGMAGAAALCAGAALRGGAGLVRVAVPRELFSVIHLCVPEATCVDRDELVREIREPLTHDGCFAKERFARYDAIAAGPGLGTGADAAALLTYLLANYKGKLVLDADALNISAALPDAGLNGRVITPHPGEAGRLLGVTSAEIQQDRCAAAEALAGKFGAVSVLKGSGTLVAVPNGSVYSNPTGNPGMATAGSGDVLAGLILALLGQGLGAEGAALAGVYIHGLAGDSAAEDKGQHGLIASDIRDNIPYAIKRLL